MRTDFNNTKELISWGIIGCGNVTEVKSGPAFSLVEGSALTAVMRRDRKKAEDYAHRHKVPKWYDDAELLMNDPDINAVYIATPPSSHKEYALSALAKEKFIYVEKPVALNARETTELVHAVQSTHGRLVVAHYRRLLPMFRFIKTLLEDRSIGDIRFVSMNLWQTPNPSLVASTEYNWRTTPAISGGGLFHDLSPHVLDLMVFYFGVPHHAHGIALNQSRTTEADDMVSGQLCFPNDILFSGTWNFCASESKDEVVIIGSKGTITFSLFGNNVTIKNSDGTKENIFEHPRHIQQPMIASVVQYFLGTGENPCPVADALTVMEIMDSFTTRTH